jgi:hypothetical protein
MSLFEESITSSLPVSNRHIPEVRQSQVDLDHDDEDEEGG